MLDILSLIGPKFVIGLDEHLDWQFPSSLQVPGWKHAWDLLLQKGLSSPRWFPAWFKGLKAIVHFFRHKDHRITLARIFRRRRLRGLADVVMAMRLPSFAEWRWSTLHKVVKALEGVLDTLRLRFDPTPFQRGREIHPRCEKWLRSWVLTCGTCDWPLLATLLLGW